MSFWPDDITTEELRSPAKIMSDAGQDLKDRTGTLTVSIKESQLEDRVVLAFHVEGVSSTLNLFEASHRIGHAYPVAIVPIASDIPDFLKGERWVSGKSGVVGLALHIQGTPGKYVKDEWVCATPAEFREQLTELFSKTYIKSLVISLLVPAEDG